MKRLLLVSLLAAFAVAVPAQAHAASPCRDRIFNDWYADGKIASTYPHACYVDALRHIPTDADEYSSLREDITAAMRAAILHSEGRAAPKQVGHGFAAHNVLVSGAQSSTHTAPHDPAPSTSSSQDPPATGQTANATVATSSSGAPLPVLALGGLALALVAAGAIGAGVKRARSRRR
jgi:hypothetical protein